MRTKKHKYKPGDLVYSLFHGPSGTLCNEDGTIIPCPIRANINYGDICVILECVEADGRGHIIYLALFPDGNPGYIAEVWLNPISKKQNKIS